MVIGDMFLIRGRLPISSFLCFIGGYSVGSWMALFHQLQWEKDISNEDVTFIKHSHEPLLLLAVMIISAPQHFEQRDTLRSTWLKLNPSQGLVKHYFVVGTEGLDDEILRRLKQENTVQNDLLILPHLKDSYQNLTTKVTQGLTSLSTTSPFHYVLKCDDDTFARLDAISIELEDRERRKQQSPSMGGTVGPDKCFYWGFFDGRAKVQKRGKWKEEDYNLCDLYIPYALGGGYILSKKCSDYIVRNQGILKTFNSEDVTIGTWLAPITHEKRHDVRFDTEFESRGCNNEYLIQHKISQMDMIERYKNLVTTGKLCSQETKKRSSYEYQWQLPPSKCCKRDSAVI